MRKLRAVSLLAVGVVMSLSFASCGGGRSTTITLSPASAQTLDPGQTVTITATVANDKNNQGVTWTLTGPGALSANTTTSVVYTAAASISTSTTATITATSVANTAVTATETITLNAVLTITTTSLPSGSLGIPYDAFVNAAGATGTFTWTITGSLPGGLTFFSTSTSNSAEISGTPTALGTSKFTVQVTDAAGASVGQALSITINQPPPLSVATASLPAGQVGVGYSQTLQASSGVPPYKWSVPPHSLPPNLTLASTGVISGPPMVAGTYPFTVQVTDSSTPTAQTATANLSITISPGATNNLKLDGNYAFSVRGFDPNGLFVAAGSFVADGNGNITGGVMDINDTGSLPVNQSFSGTYFIQDTGLGNLTFTTSGGTITFALSMLANGNANLIEFDDTNGSGTRNSGVLLKQDTSAFPTALSAGGYAFGFLGIDSSQSRFGVAGDFQSDGNGTLTSVSLDSDDAGTASSEVGLAGTSTTVAAGGRGTMTITTADGPHVYSFYVVSATELLVVGIDTFAPGGNPLVSGTILQQANSSDFNATAVFEVTGLSGTTTESQVGLFEAISGNFNLISDQNSGGTLTSPTGSGTYTITNGRAALTGTGFQNSLPVLYLVNSNQAFIIGTDSAVSFGFMTPQSGPFALSGTYAGGSFSPVEPSVSNVVSIAVVGSGNFNLTEDISSSSGLSVIQIPDTTSAPDSHGRVVVSGSAPEILYMVSSGQFFALSTDASARVDLFAQ